NAAVLTAGQIAELARIGRMIEAHFGCPQDVEWAIRCEHVYLLQSRPITTRPAGAVGESATAAVSAPGDDGWDNDTLPPSMPYALWPGTTLGEAFLFPAPPPAAPTWPALFLPPGSPGESSPPPSLGRRFYGRVYVNEGAMTHLVEEFGLPVSFLDAV